MLDLNNFAKEVHENAVKHGFWDPEPSFGEIIALCHSELSEALEAYREREPLAYVYGEDEDGTPRLYTDMADWDKLDEPEGIAVEMADCVIRILDWFGGHPKLDLEKILLAKHKYNQRRPYRHGDKTL